MYLFNAAWFGKLRGRRDDFDTQFVMLPYPYPSRYLEEHERRACHTTEEENRAVQGRIAAWLKNLPENRQTYDETARTVQVVLRRLTCFGSLEIHFRRKPWPTKQAAQARPHLLALRAQPTLLCIA